MCRERKIMLAAILCGMVYNIFLDCVSIGADYEGEIAAASAVVMAEDGSCVYEKNADEPRLVASTTKLMTALVAIEASKPDDPIEVRAECCGIEGTSMYLSPGEILTADELIEGLLLASGNDAAEALAVGLCGSLGKGADQIFDHGIVSLMTTVDAPMPLQDALDRAEELYYLGAIRMFRFIKAGMGI